MFKRILLSPVTHFNILIVGTLIIIGVMHNNYHHRMDEDVHGYVRQFCEKNLEKCQDIVEGDDYTSTTTDIHVGYEGEIGTASYYVQAGPAVVAVDGVDTETQFSGKAGLGIPVSEAVGVFGEVSFLTADDSDDLGVGGKLGLKYNF